MNAKQIELQITANQKEAMQIQNQLSQMDVSNPQRPPFVNRLEMLNRAQNYWSGEYFKVTGQRLNVPQTITVKAAPPTPTVNSIPGISADNSTENGLAQWKALRLKLRTALIGNPNYVRLESYLDTQEKIAGNGVPKIPETVVFGNVKMGSSGAPAVELSGALLANNNSYSFEDSQTIILSPNGSTIQPSAGTLMVVHPIPRNTDSPVATKIEINGTDLNKTYNVLRGE